MDGPDGNLEMTWSSYLSSHDSMIEAAGLRLTGDRLAGYL
jgi:hypothetical protein